MDQNFKLYTCYEALQLLKAGAVLRMTSASGLVKMKDKIHITLSGCTMRLKEEDFQELFASERFLVSKETTGIDEQKDEEYYAWRAKNQ